MSWLEEAWLGIGLAARLPRFLRHPLTAVEARAIVAARLGRRETSFLDTVARGAFDRPASPYRALLGLAGCERGDLERMVRQDGVEGALHALYRAGVYLTVDEFKGRRPIVRGGRTVATGSDGARNAPVGAHIPGGTSGSRGAPTPVPADLEFIRDRAVNSLVVLAAREGLGWRHATWSVPGADALVPVIRLAAAGARPSRRFMLVAATAAGLHARYRWSDRVLSWSFAVAGHGRLSPVAATLEAPGPILRWMTEARQDGATPHLYTLVSPAVRLCQAAQASGVALAGVQFTVTGEPLTAPRLAAIHQVGAEARPTYASAEAGAIGEGCLRRSTPDDVHVLRDRLAVIQPEGGEGALPGPALLISSLRPVGPFTFLNVSLGDQAELSERRCGCPLEAVGWTTHLRAIRSQEKLTAWGMSLLDHDVVRVLEEELPARFGGGPTHYQLVEDAADDGTPRLRLLIHPAVGEVDAARVSAAFLRAIAPEGGAERVVSLVWSQAGAVRVERRPPLLAASGKIHHVFPAPRMSRSGRAPDLSRSSPPASDAPK
ncbi:MAG TPA: hypothetical protein VHF87_04285 [Methylomirabilota bacterium]|jgi:hypothetical protein|nr:hypothetical protein [Methylomirabilota bacterium]